MTKTSERAEAPAGLVADDVCVHFGGLVALDGVSVAAPPNHITGLIGPNGAGKTTLFNVVCGFQRPVRGNVLMDGQDIGALAPAGRARLGLGRTFQRMELFRSLTVRQNVALAAESLHVKNNPLSQLGFIGSGRRRRVEVDEITDQLLHDTGLEAIADRLAAEISTGQARLVELARALARRPRILLLDEPSSGLDATESADFGSLLATVVRQSGVGILLIEHDMSLVLTICDWIHVLDFGRPLMAGTPAEVRSSDAVRAAYLGTEAA